MLLVAVAVARQRRDAEQRVDVSVDARQRLLVLVQVRVLVDVAQVLLVQQLRLRGLVDLVRRHLEDERVGRRREQRSVRVLMR